MAINALIEAAHAGKAGLGFAVVADEVKNISERISKIASGLTEDLQRTVNELTDLGRGMCFDVRGQRLADLSLNMISTAIFMSAPVMCAGGPPMHRWWMH